MFSAALKPKQLWLVEGAVHEYLFRFDPIQYRQQIIRFFDVNLRDDRQVNSEP